PDAVRGGGAAVPRQAPRRALEGCGRAARGSGGSGRAPPGYDGDRGGADRHESAAGHHGTAAPEVLDAVDAGRRRRRGAAPADRAGRQADALNRRRTAVTIRLSHPAGGAAGSAAAVPPSSTASAARRNAASCSLGNGRSASWTEKPGRSPELASATIPGCARSITSTSGRSQSPRFLPA